MHNSKLPQKNYKIMQSFTLKNIPDLDVCVLGALEFLSTQKLPKVNIKGSVKTLVVGSGNAEITGRILFENKSTRFADESNYKEKIKEFSPKTIIIISASGGKHAPLIAEFAKSKKIKTVLVTNNPNAPAKQYASKFYIFPKQREPYTYNTSTYLAMILEKTLENPEKIYQHINKIDKLIPSNLSGYSSFYFILPAKFDIIKGMFTTKFEELFGPKVSCMTYTEEQTKHAKTVVSSKDEMFVSFGKENTSFGEEKNRLNIPLPKNTDYGTMVALGYYLIGKIQKQNKPWFKDNIVEYCKKASGLFKENISPIVE